jgi:hypothetical protein
VDADNIDTSEVWASCPGILLTPGCTNKDVDSDNNADKSDFGIVRRCLRG